MTPDLGYYSTSPSQSLQYPNQTHTTPNTPSSIPDIILTGKPILIYYFDIFNYLFLFMCL